MKKITSSIFLLILGFQLVFPQKKVDDIGRIAITSFVSRNSEVPSSANNLLAKRLSSAVLKQGLGGTSLDNRFIITANTSEISKDITPTAPPMIAYNLEIEVFILDVIDRKIYGQETFPVKGVGTNETKAYISAIKNLRPTNKNFVSLVNESKTKIIEYYNTQCDFILKNAETLSQTGKKEQAIAVLMNIPEVCENCYNKAFDATKPIYQEIINEQCIKNLQNAKNIWNTNQDIKSANDAAVYLGLIDPNALCYNEAKKISEEIRKKITSLNDRDWDFKMKVYEDAKDYATKSLETEAEVAKSEIKNRAEVEKQRLLTLKAIASENSSKKDNYDTSWVK